MKDPQKAQAIRKVIQSRLTKAQQERPIGYLVRDVPQDDQKALRQLNQVANGPLLLDRKSTRLNSSHPSISYAVFCLKKKKTNELAPHSPRKKRTYTATRNRSTARKSLKPTDEPHKHWRRAAINSLSTRSSTRAER